jgi:flagellar biosynthetic protein FlhB
LHRVVEIDRPIPGHLYRAVAEVLAYIWRLETWKMSGGTRPVAPQFPDQLDSPSEDAA